MPLFVSITFNSHSLTASYYVQYSFKYTLKISTLASKFIPNIYMIINPTLLNQQEFKRYLEINE